MTTEDEPEKTLDDDERARSAAELQEQIDALARGEVQPRGRQQSLREFIEQREKHPAPEESPTQEASSDEGQQGESRRESED